MDQISHGRGRFDLVSIGLILLLLGPAVQFRGLYAGHFVVVAYALYTAACIFTIRGKVHLPGILLFSTSSTILLYAISFSALDPEFQISAWRHVAMLLVSFGTFATAYGMSANIMTAATCMRAITLFCYALLLLCAAEMLFNFRFAASRYYALLETQELSELSTIAERVPTGFYGNENNLAFICIALILLTLALFKSKKRWVFTAFLSFIVVATQSRMGILSLLVIAMSWLFWRKQMASTLLIVALAIGFAVGTFFYTDELLLNLPIPDSKLKLALEVLAAPIDFSDLAIRSDSIGVRVNLWSQAWDIFRQSPWFGVGPGTLNDRIAVDTITGESVVNVHNSALEILTEYGVIGSLLWLFGYAVLMWRMVRIKDRIVRKYLITLLLVFPLAAIGISSVYYFTAIWGMLGLATGLAERL